MMIVFPGSSKQNTTISRTIWPSGDISSLKEFIEAEITGSNLDNAAEIMATKHQIDRVKKQLETTPDESA
jgi:hypothetical protein